MASDPGTEQLSDGGAIALNRGKTMYERFTDRSRQVMQLADREAHGLGHQCVGTEHILLGLLREGGGVAANVLKNLGIDCERVRKRIEVLGRHEPYTPSPGERALTAPARELVEKLAHEEARALGHNYVGTEHLLFALLRVDHGLAARVLADLALGLEEVRREILQLLGHGL